MAGLKLLPIAGINNVSGDDGLQRGGDAPKTYLRDAVNIDITDSGQPYRDWETDRKSTRLNSSHSAKSRMPSSA